jgi:hypothetical protein
LSAKWSAVIATFADVLSAGWDPVYPDNTQAQHPAVQAY